MPIDREHLFTDQMELSAGRLTKNFSFLLPPTLPSTFEYQKAAKIKYRIEVKLEQDHQFNSPFKFPFTVVSHLDLNVEGDDLRLPLRGAFSKKFFLDSGSGLRLSYEIPFRGYVPGQTLHMNVSLNNDSVVKVDNIMLELRKNFLFTTNRKYLLHDSQLLVKSKHRVDPKPQFQLTCSMRIPAVEPTSERFCKYILITYEVWLILKVGGFHRSPILKIPIVIGTVPLAGTDQA